MGHKNTTNVQIDWDRFGNDVRREREKQRLSVRQAQSRTGISYNTIARVERGSAGCAADAFVTLAWWIGKDPHDYTACLGRAGDCIVATARTRKAPSPSQADEPLIVPDEMARWLPPKAASHPTAIDIDSREELACLARAADNIVHMIAANAGGSSADRDLAGALVALDDARADATSPRAHTLWELTLIETLYEIGLKYYAQAQAQRLRQVVCSVSVVDWEPDLVRRLARLEGCGRDK